jgi:hypothetical protein
VVFCAHCVKSKLLCLAAVFRGMPASSTVTLVGNELAAIEKLPLMTKPVSEARTDAPEMSCDGQDNSS